MAEDSRKIVRVSPESDKAIRAYAERKGVEMGEAADALIATAVSRLNALKRHAKNKKGEAKKTAKKAAASPKKQTRAKANGAAHAAVN